MGFKAQISEGSCGHTLLSAVLDFYLTRQKPQNLQKKSFYSPFFDSEETSLWKCYQLGKAAACFSGLNISSDKTMLRELTSEADLPCGPRKVSFSAHVPH